MLKILSYNIQVGIETGRYSDYVRHSWKHFMPHAKRNSNLMRISKLLREYDLVALQEVDAGSFRSDYTNQVEFLARAASFEHCHWQCNRNIAGIARHANGLLSRYPLINTTEHRLPGFIPGRGAIESTIAINGVEISVLAVHLSLTGRAQRRQISYLADILHSRPYFIMMGDFNCHHELIAQQFKQTDLSVNRFLPRSATYPSWNPLKSFDHIFTSTNLDVKSMHTLDWGSSDHLPVTTEVLLPKRAEATV